MSEAEQKYFSNVIKYCQRNIDLTDDPACKAANREAIRRLTDLERRLRLGDD